MKNNEHGFSIVELLLIIIVIGLVVAVGWLVYDRQKNKDQKSANTTTATTQSVPSKSSETSTKIPAKIDTSIHKVNIAMVTAEDINKLPEYIPASFKAYILNILKDNKWSYSSAEEVDTISQYGISAISQVNIAGGVSPIDKNGGGHAGGAPIIWVLNPQGTWDQESLNGPSCKSKNGGLIYVEFVKECARAANGYDWGANPNGSIVNINR